MSETNRSSSDVDGSVSPSGSHLAHALARDYERLASDNLMRRLQGTNGEGTSANLQVQDPRAA